MGVLPLKAYPPFKGIGPRFPMASTSCELSLDTVSGLYSEKWGRMSSFNERPVESPQTVLCATPRARLSLFFLYIDDAIVWLKYYRLFRLKTTWGLIINIVWHVSTHFTDTIWNFRLPLVTAFNPLEYWTKRANKIEVFGYKKGLYRTKQTFIV